MESNENGSLSSNDGQLSSVDSNVLENCAKDHDVVGRVFACSFERTRSDKFQVSWKKTVEAKAWTVD